MEKKLLTAILLCVLLLPVSGCGEQGKIDAVKKTVIPNCKGKTMGDLAAGVLQNPVWGYEKTGNGKQFVTVSGTVVGDSLPAWIRSQKIMDTTFRFALDPKTDEFDPATLDGLPALVRPEGIFQAYMSLTCL
jgi:hypothetical protein